MPPRLHADDDRADQDAFKIGDEKADGGLDELLDVQRRAGLLVHVHERGALQELAQRHGKDRRDADPDPQEQPQHVSPGPALLAQQVDAGDRDQDRQYERDRQRVQGKMVCGYLDRLRRVDQAAAAIEQKALTERGKSQKDDQTQ